jgi:uncharacterized protein YkwD
MRVRLAVVMCSTLCALGVAGPAHGQAPAKPRCAGADTEVARDGGAARAAVLCIVNAERAARGLAPLAGEGRLDAAAQGHSDDMADRGYFEHTTPEGRTPAERAEAAGYPYQSLYENIALGQTTAREVMTGWMQSTGHCRGILAPEPVDLGIGLSLRGREGPLWTQMLGLPQDAQPASADPAPADGCPYQRLSIAPGPARLSLLTLSRRGNRVTVSGLLAEEGAGRVIVVEARRAGRTTRKRIVTAAGGAFRTTTRAPRGRGRVTITATAPGVPDAYETGSDTRRV